MLHFEQAGRMKQYATPSLLALIVIGGGLGAGALGCGTVTTPEEPASIPVERESCDDNALFVGCPGAAPSTAPGGEPGDGPDPAAPTAEPARSLEELARAAAENILRSNCGQCHGSQLPPGQESGGMNYIEDLDRLVETGKIQPLDSANSIIVQRMLDGSMPPLDSDGPRPSDRDIQSVAQFIDNPQFWPGYAPRGLCDEQSISLDDVYAAVQQDVFDADDDDRPFFRYVTITNRYNAGVCLSDLDQDRWAVGKLANMLSTRARIVQPVAIDSDQLIFRLDIREYNWDRDIDVNGNNFADGWEAIIASSPYAIPFVGEEADDITRETETAVPIMPADALVEAAAVGNLYYALIGVDVNQSLNDFVENDLAIDIEQNIDQGEVVRAGTTRSRISREDRVIERHEIGNRVGVYWQTFDFDGEGANDSIFLNPFDFNAAGTQAIFTLPNGMLAFLIADENGQFEEETNLLFDTLQGDFIARTSVSCANCHAAGFNPVVDEVAPFVQQNRFSFNREDFEAVSEIYLSPADFAQVIANDSAQYEDRLQQVGIPEEQPDPVSNVFLRFEDSVDLATVAGDLHITPEVLDRELNLLDPRLAILRDVSIDRNEFTDVFLDSMCIMHLVSRNSPDPALCD